MKLPKLLAEPDLPNNLPSNAYWLAGEGAGSWFVIEKKGVNYYISRFSPQGSLECEGDFSTNELFDLDVTFSITYPSHCIVVSVLQGGKEIKLTRI